MNAETDLYYADCSSKYSAIRELVMVYLDGHPIRASAASVRDGWVEVGGLEYINIVTGDVKILFVNESAKKRFLWRWSNSKHLQSLFGKTNIWNMEVPSQEVEFNHPGDEYINQLFDNSPHKHLYEA